MGTITSPTKGAVEAIRKSLAGTLVPAGTAARDLTDTQWEWLFGIGLGGWITTRAEDAVRAGRTIDGAILGSNRHAVDTGTIRTILPELGALDYPWTKPIGDWSQDDITGLVLAILHLVETAEKARQKIVPLSEEMNDRIPY